MNSQGPASGQVSELTLRDLVIIMRFPSLRLEISVFFLNLERNTDFRKLIPFFVFSKGVRELSGWTDVSASPAPSPPLVRGEAHAAGSAAVGRLLVLAGDLAASF